MTLATANVLHLANVLQGSVIPCVRECSGMSFIRRGCPNKKQGCALDWFRHQLFSDSALLYNKVASEKTYAKYGLWCNLLRRGYPSHVFVKQQHYDLVPEAQSQAKSVPKTHFLSYWLFMADTLIRALNVDRFAALKSTILVWVRRSLLKQCRVWGSNLRNRRLTVATCACTYY
jgi:hypothetical protein